MVALSERVEAAAIPFVGIDNLGAARDVAHRLADLGHACLAHVAGPPGNSLSVEREHGFALGLAERGLLLTGTRAGDWSIGSGERAAAALLAGPDRPTALFAANDEMAIGAIRAAAALGLAVPGDLSVVGFDDIDFAALHAPALTTVRQPRFAMGRAAVACLTARIEAGPRPVPPGHPGPRPRGARQRRHRAAPPRPSRPTPTPRREDFMPDLLTPKTAKPKTLKGPGLFLAQFAGDTAPFDTFDAICRWAGGLGYRGVQVPTWDARLFDLARAAESKTYCDEVAGTAAAHGLAVTELSTHLQGQLVAVNPAFDAAFDGFAPEAVRGTRRPARPGRSTRSRWRPAPRATSG